jgi:hypothetical protein
VGEFSGKLDLATAFHYVIDAAAADPAHAHGPGPGTFIKANRRTLRIGLAGIRPSTSSSGAT